MPVHNRCHAEINTAFNYNIILLIIGTTPYMIKILFIFHVGGNNMLDIIENTIYFIVYLISSCWHA